MRLDGPVDDLQRHLRDNGFDHCDLLAGGLASYGIHLPGAIQDEQPCLIDLAAGLGYPVSYHPLIGDRLTEGFPALRSLDHQLQRALSRTNQPHAMMNPSRPEPSLSDLEPAA